MTDLSMHGRAGQAAELAACPHCDALQHVSPPAQGGRVRCVRCRIVLMSDKGAATWHILLLAVTVLALMVGVVVLPFLTLHTRGLTNESSVLDAALAFSGGAMAPLAWAVLALIVMVPAARALLLLYALGPLVLGRPPLPGARRAFAWDEELKPWSMAEIFIIGVAVALVKITELATVGIGPAFWLMTALVIVSALQDTAIDRHAIWAELDRSDPDGATRSHG